MKLKKCSKCGEYTLKEEHCGEKTKEAHYKFVKIRDVKERSNGIFINNEGYLY